VSPKTCLPHKNGLKSPEKTRTLCKRRKGMRHPAFAIPYEWIHARLESLNFTDSERGKHWHILVDPTDDGQLVLRLKNGKNEPLDNFRVMLGNAATV
jgi:hypothetical protein